MAIIIMFVVLVWNCCMFWDCIMYWSIGSFKCA